MTISVKDRLASLRAAGPRSDSGVLSLGARIGLLVGAIVLGWMGAGQNFWFFAALALVLGAVMIGLTWRRPDVACLVVIAGLPIYAVVYARLMRFGVPASVFVLGRFWKETLLVLLVVFVVTRVKMRFHLVDWLAFAFLLLLAFYIAAPFGASTLDGRLAGFRQDGLFIVVFLVARQLPLPASFGKHAATVLLLLGVVLAGFGVWNHFYPEDFTNWILTSGLPLYSIVVTGVRLGPTVQYVTLSGTSFLRAGSLFLSPVNFAFFMIIPLAIVLARVVHGKARRWEMVAGVVCLSGLLLSLTRSAIASTGFMVALALIVARGRTRLLVVLLVAIAAVTPFTGNIGLNEGLQAATDSSDAGTAAHIGALSFDILLLLSFPLGTGLGTSGSVAQRYETNNAIVNESWFFQIGSEAGIAGMLLYITVVLVTLAVLWRRARAGHWEATAAMCGLAALSLCGLVLHSLQELSVSWTIWMLAGYASRGASDGPVEALPEPADETPAPVTLRLQPVSEP